MKSINTFNIVSCLMLIASPVMAQTMGDPVISPMEQQQVQQGTGQQMSPAQAEQVYGSANQQQEQQSNNNPSSPNLVNPYGTYGSVGGQQ